MSNDKLPPPPADAKQEAEADKVCSLKTEEREWLCSKNAAAYLGISVGSLMNMVSARTVPAYKLGRRNRYRREELRQLLLSNRIGA